MWEPPSGIKILFGENQVNKKIVFGIVGAVVAIALIGTIAAGPYLTLNSIKKGLVNQDTEILADNIDFQSVRVDLKEQFNAMLNKKMASMDPNNPFAAFGAALASKLVESIVDRMATPAGLAQAFTGDTPKNAQDSVPEEKEMLKNASYSYDSLNKFSVHVPSENGGEVRIILERMGLFSWKLVRLSLPLEESSNN